MSKSKNYSLGGAACAIFAFTAAVIGTSDVYFALFSSVAFVQRRCYAML